MAAVPSRTRIEDPTGSKDISFVCRTHPNFSPKIHESGVAGSLRYTRDGGECSHPTMSGPLYFARSAASLAEVPAILAVLLETAWKLLARKRILGVLSDQLARRSTVRCEPTWLG